MGLCEELAYFIMLNDKLGCEFFCKIAYNAYISNLFHMKLAVSFIGNTLQKPVFVSLFFFACFFALKQLNKKRRVFPLSGKLICPAE